MFELAFIELEVLVDGGLAAQWPNARICDESRRILYLTKQCGVKNVIVSDIPEGVMGNIDLSPIDGLAYEIQLNVVSKEMAIRETLRRLGEEVSPENAIHLDNKAYGIQEAHWAGIIAFGITTGYSTREEMLAAKPHILGRSLNDFWMHVYSQIRQ